jgi:hypothetical protein
MPMTLRVAFLRSAFTTYADLERKEAMRKALPAVGNPALRQQCCGRRKERFEAQKMVKNIPELLPLLHPRGSALYDNYFQCSVCGQEWVEIWTQEKMGGFYEVAKV